MYKNLKSNTYKLEDTSRDSLKALGWYYSPKYSTSTENYFTYSFPAYKNNGISLLECELIVNQESHIVDIEVYDLNRKPYAPFYDSTYSSHNLVLTIVENNIRKKLRSFKIKNEHKN